MKILVEFMQFLKVRKRLWLLPLIIIFVVLGFLLILAEGSAIATFIYTIF